MSRGISKADYERETHSVAFEPSIDEIDLSDKVVLVIDSAIHTGSSMQSLIRALQNAGVERVLSYSLVLKGGSLLIPTYFGVVIDDKDRTYFELDGIPNNRLHDTKMMDGVLRALTDNDANITIEVGAPFEGLCVGDLLYDKETRSSKVYGYEENGELTGFISFRKNGNILFIDSLGVIESRRKFGISSALCRWAETWGRSAKCTAVDLWGYEKVLEIYDYYGYKPVTNEWRTLGLNHRFKLMRKPLLYNIKVTQDGNDEYRGQAD
jgi:GNAT superfamily N-acetyltransferase